MVNHPMIAARLRTELNSVAPATRLELLRLLGAKAVLDAAQTQRLHQEALSLATTPRAVLRRVAWHRMTTSKRVAHAGAERWLQPDELQRDVEIMSRELAVLVAAKQADAWLRLALEAWGAAPASASASASHPTATAKASLLLRDLSHIDGIAGVKHGAPMSWTQALRRISRLSPMARPQLMRAWSQATAALGLADNLAAVETLMCVCTALDTPYVPPTSVGLPSVKSAKSVTHAAATTHSPPDARREASPTIG
jgi:hypothetical protein